jgi:hypothetical protein
VIKSVKDIEVAETCPVCGEFAIRQFVPTYIHLSKTAVQHAEFNPGLGCVTKNREHVKEICKQKDLVEIGNDYKSADSQLKEADTARAEKLAKRWETD